MNREPKLHTNMEIAQKNAEIEVLLHHICMRLQNAHYIAIGCGRLWSCDGNWKLSYPIACLIPQKKLVGFLDS